MKIAVLGEGTGAHATVADLALAGHDVRLWLGDAGALTPVRQAGGIDLVAEGRQGRARLDLLTADLGEAVRGAEVVVVSLPATSHQDLAARLAPHLDERHVVLLAPGILGSLVMAREMARAGGTLPNALVEAGALPCLAEPTGPAAVKITARAVNLPVGVFPSSRTESALARVAELYPASRRTVDVLDVALTNPGPVVHPPLVLLNAGVIDRGGLDGEAAASAPSVRRLVEVVDAERVAARRGFRYPAPHWEVAPPAASEGIYGTGAGAPVATSGVRNETLGLDHRYVTEDVVLGLSFLESAARTVSVDTPAISGLLGVFGALLGRRLSGQGRALEALGLGDLVLREIRSLFDEGWASPLWRKIVS